MSARYGSTGNHAVVAAAYGSMLEIKGGTTLRARIYDWMFGADGTPADNALVYLMQKTTAVVGVGTSVTPEPLDPADPAAEATALEDLTTEPTLAGIPIIELPVNLRASYRWVAAPGSEIVIAAVANEGVDFAVKSATYAGTAKSSVLHEE